MSDPNNQPPPTPPGNPKADAKAAKAYAKASRPWYKKKRYWLLGFVLLIVIISAASGGGDVTETASDSGDTSSASDDSGSESKEPAEEEKAEEPAEKPMKVDAGTIIKDYEDNEAAADGKYSGKLLQVSGVIEKVDTDFIDEDEYIVRVGAGGQWDFLTVDCPGQSADAVSSLKKGDDITVVGEFDDGGDLGVTLKDCTIR